MAHGDEDKEQGFPGQTEKGREEEVMSEVAERAMEIDLKTLVSNEISHAKRVDVIAEQSLQNAVNFAEKANDAYLEQAKSQALSYQNAADARLKETGDFVNSLHKNFIENNRYTLDRLYSVFPEEAMGIGAMVSLVVEALKKSGWTPPASG